MVYDGSIITVCGNNAVVVIYLSILFTTLFFIRRWFFNELIYVSKNHIRVSR